MSEFVIYDPSESGGSEGTDAGLEVTAPSQGSGVTVAVRSGQGNVLSEVQNSPGERCRCIRDPRYAWGLVCVFPSGSVIDVAPGMVARWGGEGGT